MNVLGQRERSWRKARKRGVSPIIATILLVAITVVLAAVLYVLISGLTRGPGNTPLGSAFAAGSANLITVPSTGTGVGCSTPAAGTEYCYTLTIEQASTGLTLSSIGFEVRTTAGTAFAVKSISISSVSSTSTVTTLPVTCAGPVCNGGSGTTSWTYGTTGICAAGACGAGTQISSATMNIVIDMGTTSPTGNGYTLVGLAQGSYSGTVTATLP
jgi:archaeal type IV pilus assembly protein PilA